MGEGVEDEGAQFLAEVCKCLFALLKIIIVFLFFILNILVKELVVSSSFLRLIVVLCVRRP